MTLEEMVAELPKECTVNVKRNAKGYKESCPGYKAHIDVADGGIPISVIVTSASLHDSQVAIPLATKTAQCVDNMYDLMDSAYDAEDIRAHSMSLGHMPIIDENPRRRGKAEPLQERKAQRAAGFVLPHRVRYTGAFDR